MNKNYPYACFTELKIVDLDNCISPTSTLAIFVHNTKLANFKSFGYMSKVRTKADATDLLKEREGLKVKTAGLSENGKIEYVEYDLKSQESYTDDENEEW